MSPVPRSSAPSLFSTILKRNTVTFDLPQILASKRAFRHALAARDILEKLRMLDALRERALALRPSRCALNDEHRLRDAPAPYSAVKKTEG